MPHLSGSLRLNMKINPAARLTELPLHFFASYADTLAKLEAQGIDVIHLDVGSPDLPPPDAVIRTLAEKAAEPHTHGYQSHRWTASYRNAWSDFYRQRFAVNLDPDLNILPLIGSKEGIFHLMLAMLNPEDVVLVPNPGYITYLRGTQLAGGQPHQFVLDEKSWYLPDFASIPSEIISKAKILWLNYPNNPTSATAGLDFFAEALDFARKNNLLVCHDAAYTQITYENFKAHSLLEIGGALENAVEFNTLSKSHNMAGWRVGILAGNADVIQALYKLKSSADSGHFLPIIEAATTALATPQEWLDQRNLIYQERRDILHAGLVKLGFNLPLPMASLYIWWKLPDGIDAASFTTDLLENTHVSGTPGNVFGSQGEGYIRLSLTESTQRIIDAVDRLTNWINHGTAFSNRG